ncbi:MAG TPA: hypothetical protein VGN64_16955 [Dyadobacter sp.]|nr:hypothetical protein [Dyadobacter sp.]
MKSIRFCYRKVIDVNARTGWEKAVCDATHLEFYMQAQRLDPEGKYTTFAELADHIPDAIQLHYLVSTAAIGYVRHLGDVMPDVQNALGLPCLPFHDFKFEILSSHLKDKAQHRIAISFYSDPVLWLEFIGNHMLITSATNSEKLRSGEQVETELIAMSSYLSISHYTSINL